MLARCSAWTSWIIPMAWHFRPTRACCRVANPGGRPGEPEITALAWCDGALHDRRRFSGVPDGLAEGFWVDRQGWLWSSSGAGACILVPEGHLLGLVPTPRTASTAASIRISGGCSSAAAAPCGCGNCGKSRTLRSCTCLTGQTSGNKKARLQRTASGLCSLPHVGMQDHSARPESDLHAALQNNTRRYRTGPVLFTQRCRVRLSSQQIRLRLIPLRCT